MKDRIKEVRQTYNLSQEDFGKRLGVSRGVITNIELNKVSPKPLFIDLICKVFGVNKHWLVTGDGEMFEDMDDDAKFELICTEIANSDDIMLKNAIKTYWKLSAEHKKVVWDFLDSISSK